MTTELDELAKKNLQQKIDEGHKELNIKQHNIRAAQKANKADTPPEDRSLLEKIIGTKKQHSLAKEYRKTKKIRKSLRKTEDRLDKHGVWSKENKKGAAMGHYEKKKIIEKGFPSKAKMAKGGRAGFAAGSKGCKLAMKGKGRAYGKNS
tara:strand:+ start:140 stop:586 length:447 start_codon:yes stop_codon:yes gene_type:complete